MRLPKPGPINPKNLLITGLAALTIGGVASCSNPEPVFEKKEQKQIVQDTYSQPSEKSDLSTDREEALPVPAVPRVKGNSSLGGRNLIDYEQNAECEKDRFNRESFFWDDNSYWLSENISHTSNSKELDSIVGGGGGFKQKYIGILDDVDRCDWGSLERFYWIPGIGTQVLMAKFNVPKTDESDGPVVAAKTLVAWFLSSEFRYYTDKDTAWDWGWLHISHDRFGNDINLEEASKILGVKVNEEDVNVLYLSRGQNVDLTDSLNFQYRLGWNIHETLPQPWVEIRSLYDDQLNKKYRYPFFTENILKYEPIDGFHIAGIVQAEIPNLLEHDERGHTPRVPRNFSLEMGTGMFNFFYTVGRGRPPRTIDTDRFGNWSNRDVIGIRFRNSN